MTGPGFDPGRLGPPAGSRVAVVGGCGGMGRAVVQALVQTGVQVAVLDLPASLASSPPPGDIALEVDASRADSVERAFAALAGRWPALDGFVNLAGFFKGLEPLKDLPVEVFDEVIAGNLRNHYLCAKAALPMLHARGPGAAMVCVASTMASDVVKRYAHYGAAKAGIVALVKGMARENAPTVRVNAVAPGLTNTAFLVGGTGRDKIFAGIAEEVYAKRVPMKRMAQPVDMAGPILFLLGAASGFVNGETLIVDGGVYVQ